ncbi:MAG: tRNA (guanosine(46)-N7)-methyltransferase TrmB [Gammaproteobacteria bacterium]|nr:tRNA (guanosine(46)-N7)-methyltransferase TrmB [Gammaproteobacteria bacterium]
MPNSNRPLRTVRSFVRRIGRTTAAQQRALDEMWPRVGLEPGATPLNFIEIYGRSAPLTLEIGFGMGDALAPLAATHPEQDFLGIEVHRPGVGRLLSRLGEQGSTNVRVLCADAVDILQTRIPDQSFDRVLIFFPDPWHKKKHHKRRLIQPDFIQLLRRKLKVNGVLHLATDWQDYAEWMMDVLNAAEGFENLAGAGQCAERPDYRPVTKFESRGQRLGHGIWDLLFKKIS